MPRFRVVVPILGALSACSLAVDLDGLSGGGTTSDGGPDVALATDGAAAHDAVDEALRDAPADRDRPSLDARVPDAEAGAADAATDDTSGPLDPCAPSPTVFFCDAFGASPLGATWDHNSLVEGSIDTAAFVSPPSSLRVSLAASNDITAHYLAKDLTPPASTGLDIAFALRVDQAEPIYPVGIFCGNSGYSLSLNLDSSGMAEQGGGVSYTEHATSATFPTGVWRHVEILLRRADGTVEVHVDGAVVLPLTTLLGKSNVTPGSCTFVLGMFYAPTQTPWLAHFDDVRITTL
jgi:hypothetical protein